VPTPVVDVGYEFELFYNNIFKDSVDGGELVFLSGLGGRWKKVVELMENKDGTRFEYKRRRPLLICRLFFQGPSIEPLFC
jgi:hypothetical protein